MITSANISLLISVFSLLAAAYVGVRQYRAQRNSNNVPAILEMLAQIQKPTFNENFDFVVSELGNYSPDGGLSSLPAEAKIKVFDVCYFLQQVAMLILMDLIDEKLFTAYFRARTIYVWEKIEPYVRKDRELNPLTGPEFLTPLEAFAAKARRITPGVGQEIIAKWLAKDNRRWSQINIITRMAGRPQVWKKAYSDAMGAIPLSELSAEHETSPQNGSNGQLA